MKRIFPLIVVFAVIFVWAIPASMARTAMNHAALNNQASRVIIVSGSAANQDLHLNWLRSFGAFESSHPAIAHAFRRDPTLLISSRFLREHPQWAGYLTAHPDIAADIAPTLGIMSSSNPATPLTSNNIDTP